MIHILVFVIKAIVKAINANSSARNTSKTVVNGTNDYPNSVQSTSTKATVNKVYPKSTSSTDSIIKGDRLDINKIDIYQFLSIPVMSYSQALLIIAERNDKGKYLDIEDLKSRNNLDPKIASALSERIYFG